MPEDGILYRHRRENLKFKEMRMKCSEWCKIWGFHDSDYEEWPLLRGNTNTAWYFFAACVGC
jgi:hypothetical protein